MYASGSHRNIALLKERFVKVEICWAIDISPRWGEAV